MNKIDLNSLQLKIFTEQDALDYCSINNINPDNITELYLGWNELTDISGIKLFKNLKKLWLNENKITDISDLKDLKTLIIAINKIKDISVLKYLNNLEFLGLASNQIKDISAIQYLKNLFFLHINNLELQSDQIQYIKSLNNLKELWCHKGFKDKSVLNQLNKNIKVTK